MTTLPASSHEVRLLRRPSGMPRPSDVEVVDTPLRHDPASALLVRNRWFRVSISTRLMMREGIEQVKGIPFPPLRPGDTLADGAIGQVVGAPAGSRLRVGDWVSHPLGWRDYASVRPALCTRLDADPPDPVLHLGHGWTAYAALTRGIRVQARDTVFVTSGAGAIGSMAGQIARRLGAARVIGSTGSRDKVAWMKAALGYDEVVVRGEGPLAPALARAAPDGIDVLVDMVGGEQLAAAAGLARQGARFVLLGALGAELAAADASLRAPVTLDSFGLVLRGVTLRGYSADDDAAAFGDWLRQAADWGRDGGLHLPCARFVGIARAPQALHEACLGRLRGVVLVELPQAAAILS